MSPEQASGAPVDGRSDIFAFGVLLYEMLTGRHPFRRATTLETLAAIRDDEPPPPSRIVSTVLPHEIDRAVLRCLRKEPASRWQSLSDLAAVLQDLKEDSDSGRACESRQDPRARRSVLLAGRWAAGLARPRRGGVCCSTLVSRPAPAGPPRAAAADLRRRPTGARGVRGRPHRRLFLRPCR